MIYVFVHMYIKKNFNSPPIPLKIVTFIGRSVLHRLVNLILLSNERMIGKCEWEGCQNVLRGNMNPLNTLKSCLLYLYLCFAGTMTMLSVKIPDG